MGKERIEKNKNKKKYEKEFFQCGECKFNGEMKEVVNHGNAKEHYEKTRSLGKMEYIPTIEEAQNCGDVIFEDGKRWHEPCGEYLAVDSKKDKKGNIVSINFSCQACGQQFKTRI